MLNGVSFAVVDPALRTPRCRTPPPSNVTNVTNAMPVCNLAPDPVLPSEEDEGLECHRTDLGVICVNSSSASNASVVGKRCQSCMFYLRVLYS